MERRVLSAAAFCHIEAEKQLVVAEVEPPAGNNRLRPDLAHLAWQLGLLRDLEAAVLCPPRSRRGVDQYARPVIRVIAVELPVCAGKGALAELLLLPHSLA